MEMLTDRVTFAPAVRPLAFSGKLAMEPGGQRRLGRTPLRRFAFVIGLMIVGISMMLWAGWHNLRERRIAMQQAQQKHVTLAPTSGNPPQTSEAPELDLRGKAAPSFSLTTLDGKKVALSDYKGRPVLVNFWATWCAPCKLEMPWFEQFHSQYAPEGLEILGIAEDDAGKDEIAKTAKRLGVTYPILLTDGKTAPKYGGIDYLPMSFFIGRNGLVVEETAGLGSKDQVEANIRKIVSTPSSGAAGGI